MAIELAKLKYTRSVRPFLVLVAKATDKATGRQVSCGNPAWHMDSAGNVVIDSVSGLSPGGSYRIEFVLLG
jgi:hypothetical protein